MTTTATERGTATLFVHPALFYRDDQEYLAGTVPFVREGLAASEPVAVAAPAARLALITAELGRAADAVHLVDMTLAGRNPGRIIPSVLCAFADARTGVRVRIVGEPVWPGRTAEEYPACVQHEALINEAFSGRDVIILCPYDARSLPSDVLDDARATHPLLIDGGRRSVSDAYDPQKALARCNEPLRPPPGAAAFPYDADTLPAVRDFALAAAREWGMSEVRLQDLALVVAELTTNSVVHAGGGGTLRLWEQDGRIVCQVQDLGRLSDPLVGRRPARPDQIGGRGLLLVHCLSDLVRLHTDDEGTTIRSYVARA
ncbi:anti-sigma regulatory factor (Ser/Thr protein kinase) [Streptomyces sp. V3I8]|uniref:sensor histidine kinase n=1 Tax=Streptomyces sp. V3I8 TaxID=3042279 RepID=UPI002785B50C|nr:sensor histidine kinase [Streptomyces sp. V3I8]MDQ1040940.1 anti-sigma regulatory factor (Ser/Thr protein kinase) [Streptomyces sp. V3I8]